MKAAEVPVGEQAARAAGNPARRNRFVIVLVAAVLIIAASAAAVIALRWHQRDSLTGPSA